VRRPDRADHRPPPADHRRCRLGGAAGRRAGRRAGAAVRPAGSGREVRRLLAGPDRNGGSGMIRLLLRVLGPEYARPVRRTIALMAVTAALEGLAYALLVPVLGNLLAGDPAGARPWLIGFGGAVAGYAALRYLSDLSGFRVGTTMLRGMYHRLGDHLARLPLGWYDTARVGEVGKLASGGVLQAMSVIAHLLG